MPYQRHQTLSKRAVIANRFHRTVVVQFGEFCLVAFVFLLRGSCLIISDHVHSNLIGSDHIFKSGFSHSDRVIVCQVYVVHDYSEYGVSKIILWHLCHVCFDYYKPVIDKSLDLEKSREEMTPYFLARSRKLDFHFSFYS